MTPDSEVARAIREVWPRVRYVATERLELLIRSACALGQGPLDEDARAEALQAAHKLAGALGTYGFPEGSSTARRAERLLDAGRHDPGELDEVVRELMALRVRLDRDPGGR
jgi:HPt (histidine-containing phosphotransfer) domain-containing protein